MFSRTIAIHICSAGRVSQSIVILPLFSAGYFPVAHWSVRCGAEVERSSVVRSKLCTGLPLSFSRHPLFAGAAPMLTLTRAHRVTRLIKVSKSQKPTRDSFIATITPTSPEPSGSSTSLTSPSLMSANTKLSAAQAELQACEAMLAQKEQALDKLRIRAVKEGLQARCMAMVECGWAWGEMGKEGLRALEDFNDGDGAAVGSACGCRRVR
jgi:hypothetical protein